MNKATREERRQGPSLVRGKFLPESTYDERLLDQRGSDRVAAHGPLAGAAHPGRVRRGLRPLAELPPAVSVFGSARTPATAPSTRSAERLGGALAEAGYAVITGGGPGVMEAANKGRPRGGRRLGRARHRAALRAGAERLRRPRHRLPLLLRPQDDVREVRPGVRRAARRLRHARRAVRGAHAGPDRARSPRSRSCSWARRTGAGCSTGSASPVLAERQDLAQATSTCSTSPTTWTRPCASSSRATSREHGPRAVRGDRRSAAGRT